jgi:hypothetical protein
MYWPHGWTPCLRDNTNGVGPLDRGTVNGLALQYARGIAWLEPSLLDGEVTD